MPDSEVTKDDLEALTVLLAEVRDGLREATPAHAPVAATPPEATLLHRVEDLVDVLSRQAQPRPGRRSVWVVVPLLTLVLGGGMGWYAARRGPQAMLAQAQLMGQVDALLTTRYDTLPPALREALQGLYAQAGFQPLRQRGPKEARR